MCQHSLFDWLAFRTWTELVNDTQFYFWLLWVLSRKNCVWLCLSSLKKKHRSLLSLHFELVTKTNLTLMRAVDYTRKSSIGKFFAFGTFFSLRELTSSKTLPQLAVIRRQSTPSGSMAWLMCFKASFQLRLQRRENAERLLVCFPSDESSFLLCFKFSQSKLLHLTYFAKWDEGEASCTAQSETDLWRRSDGRITKFLSLFHSETIFSRQSENFQCF